MKKSLIAAMVLILIGTIIFAGAMWVLDWDFTKLSTEKFETTTHTISESFRNITITTDTADIRILPTTDETVSVVCFQQEKAKHNVTAENETLTIALADTRRWYDYIGFFFATPKITVYLPQQQYGHFLSTGSTGDVVISQDFRFESIAVSQSTGDVKNYASAQEITISTDTGSILVKDIETDHLQLSVSTGKVTAINVICHQDVGVTVSTGDVSLSNVRSKTFDSRGNTGDITLTEVVAVEKMTIERTTGDITFQNADASEISAKTDTGDVIGNLRTSKVFITQTDTGDIDVPQTTSGGKCQITTNTGDIKINIK